MKKTYKAFLRNYYLSGFFYDFIFAYAVYNLLFSLRGLSVFQISLLLSWWALVALILEIPTGALADHWNRKKMLTIAPFIKSLCFIVWFFANGNFYLYLLGFVFWALGSTLISGTTESLLYDTLVHFNKKDEYEKILGRKKFYFNISLAISIIVGGFIASYKLDYAILLSILPLLLSSLFASLILEVPRVKSTGEVKYFDHIKDALQEIKTNKALPYLFIFLLGISVFGDLEEFDQLYYQLAKLPIYAFGIAGFIWSALNATASYFSHQLKEHSWVFYLFPLFSATLLLLVALFPSIPMIGALLLSYFFATPLRILIEGKIQHQIKSASRATVTSTGTMFVNLLGVVLVPVFGLIGKVFDLPTIYLSTVIFLAVFSLWTFAYRKKISVDNDITI